ncbi:hypothetical protein V2J09_013725 [Rumex salicifolius]
MASETKTTTTEAATTEAATTEYEKGTPPPLPPPPPPSNGAWDALMRVVLLAASVVAVVVMVTSKETKLLQLPFPGRPGMVLVPRSAKFQYSPAFIYFVVALSVAGLYSIITGLASLSVVWKPSIPAKCLFFLIVTDVLVLGIIASATGTAGSIAYLGLKGNSHVNWNKICDPYGKFCRYVGSSVAVSLFACVVLVTLIIGNAHSLYLRAAAAAAAHPKC